MPLLASVPLSTALRQAGDAGTPIVGRPGNDEAAAALEALATAVASVGRGLSGRRLPIGL